MNTTLSTLRAELARIVLSSLNPDDVLAPDPSHGAACEEQQAVESLFGGRRVRDCPWSEFVNDPTMVSWICSSSITQMLPSLILYSLCEDDLLSSIASRLSNCATDSIYRDLDPGEVVTTLPTGERVTLLDVLKILEKIEEL
jgi:hypothetical protein